MTEKRIETACIKHGITNYTINKDTSIDVYGNVDISSQNLKKIPLKFRVVTGSFNCSNNNLTSLVGAPKSVGKRLKCDDDVLFYRVSTMGFDCSHNKLTSLVGSPIKIGGDFDCSYNRLDSLSGITSRISLSLYCSNNELTSLENGPTKVGEYFDCSHNKLTDLVGVNKGLQSYFNCSNNLLTTIEGYPKKVASFDCSNNQLSTLEDCPKKVRCIFKCKNNHKLTHRIFWSTRFYQINCDDYLLRGYRRESVILEILKSKPLK
jgi:Leucine-rich repeat (LRR) protein